MNKIKKCKQCQTDIPLEAKKCPRCQSDQRNWFQRHPSKTIALIFIALSLTLVTLMTFISYSIEKVIPQNEIDTLKGDLWKWAEGRWDNLQIEQNKGTLVIRVYAKSEANEVALSNYCRVIKESAQKNISDYNERRSSEKIISILQNGKFGKSCF
ncbi:MAG: hypothetical protein PHC89_00990 [Candidatus Pacebacteria bacterium]|nr:hypothetical protein [Candidatus Paceibacterota bacterium]